MAKEWFVSDDEMVEALSDFCEGCALSNYDEYNSFREYHLLIKGDDGYVKNCISFFVSSYDIAVVLPYDGEIACKIQDVLNGFGCRNVTCRFMDNNMVVTSEWRR